MGTRSFPAGDGALVYQPAGPGGALLAKTGTYVTIYTDEAATTVATGLTYPNGSPVVDGRLLVGATSRLPRFVDPAGRLILYSKPDGSSIVTALYADSEEFIAQANDLFVPLAGDATLGTGMKTIVGGKIAINGEGFTQNYDTDLFIAGPTRTNPTLNSQGLYIQHRISGDLGGLVNDAGASELRLFGIANTGAGQSAHENSLVLTGGANAAGLLTGSLANFHTSGAPTGTIAEVDLFRGTQIPPLPAGLTIGTVIGLRVDPQIVGQVNYSLYAPDGDSVLGVLRPKTAATAGLRIKGLAAQTADLLRIVRSTDVLAFQVTDTGGGGFGPAIAAASVWVNNQQGSGSNTAFAVRGASSQTADLFHVGTSAAVKLAVGAGGDVRLVNTNLLMRNSADSGTVVSVTPTGFRWNDSTLERTTVGAAGAAAALPATPTKYLQVRDSANNTLLVPAYAAV